MIHLPPLSRRITGLLRSLAANESFITSRFEKEAGFGAPRLLHETTELVNKTLVRIMEEIEKGPGEPPPFP